MYLKRPMRATGLLALAGAMLVGIAPTASADSTREKQWALEAFDVDKLWGASEGEGVTVAVVDDGVDAAHADVRDNVLKGSDVVGGGPGNVTTEGHGTAMASLIAGHGHGSGNDDGVRGLAPKAKILPVKAVTEDGKFNTTTVSAAIHYAVEQRADVINISLSGSFGNSAVKRAIKHAWENDVIVVSGSGNSGLKGVDVPARLPGVVAVGSITEAGIVSEQSNYGEELMLTAPGDGIESAALDQGYTSSNGTSNAAAYVSAAAALVRAKFPDLTAGQVINRLTKTALLPDKTGKAPDEYYGYGMIRPFRALTEDVPTGSSNGPLTAPEGAGELGSQDTGGPGDEAKADQSEDDGSKSSSLPIYLGLGGVAAIAVLTTVFALVARNRRRRNNPPPPPGGWGGGLGGSSGPFPQQGQPPLQANYPQGPGGPPPGPPGHYPQGPPPGSPRGH